MAGQQARGEHAMTDSDVSGATEGNFWNAGWVVSRTGCGKLPASNALDDAEKMRGNKLWTDLVGIDLPDTAGWA